MLLGYIISFTLLDLCDDSVDKMSLEKNES